MRAPEWEWSGAVLTFTFLPLISVIQLVGVPAHIHRYPVGATRWRTGWLHGLSWSEANDLSEVNRANVALGPLCDDERLHSNKKE